MSSSEEPRIPGLSKTQNRAVVLAAVNLLLWSGLFLAFLWLVPQCERIFAEFGVELPVATILVLKIGYLVCSYWFLFAALLLLGIAAEFAILRLAGDHGRRLQLAVALLLTSVPLLLGAFVLVNCVLPLVRLFKSIT